MTQRTSPAFRSTLLLLLGLCLCGPMWAQTAQPPLPNRLTPLAAAVMKEDTVTAQKLLDGGANVNAPLADGRPVLFYAIAYQRIQGVTFLLAHGADIHTKDKEGKTPLHWAVSVSSPLTEMLVEKGADVNAVDQSGETPLYQAILHNPARAIYLIAHGARVTVQNNKFETPLHIAIFGAGQIELIKTLLAKGADVNALDQDGQTPLDQTFDADVTALLVAHGAVHGKRGPATATSSPLITTLPSTLTPILLTTRLRRALESDDLYAVQTLLAKGADAKAPDVDGSLPLAVALRIGSGAAPLTPIQPAILNALLTKGVDVNTKEAGSGRTLLILAVLYHQLPSLNWLLAHGAKVNLRDTQLGATALNYADDPATIRALLAKGAGIDAQDAEGYTALMSVATDGKTDSVRVLLAAHAHVNIKNKHGETALALVRKAQAKNKKQDMSGLIRLLKQAGAK